MIKTKLLELIKNGENSSVVFQLDTIDNRALGKEFVALLNLRGGRVILGVDDDGSVTGITRDRIPARKKIIPPKNVYLFAAR